MGTWRTEYDRKMKVIKINPFTWHIYKKTYVQCTIMMTHTNTQAYSYQTNKRLEG